MTYRRVEWAGFQEMRNKSARAGSDLTVKKAVFSPKMPTLGPPPGPGLNDINLILGDMAKY